MKKRDLVKKGILVSIGLGAITKEKIEKYVSKLKKEGYLNVSEGKNLAKEMFDEGKRMETKLQSAVHKRVRTARKAMQKAEKKVKPKASKKTKKSTKKKTLKKKTTKKKVVKKTLAKRKK